MDWEEIENNWDEFKWKVKQNWDALSEQQLEMVEGNRERIARVIQRIYKISAQEAEQQLSDWQHSQINIDGHFYELPSSLSSTYR